MSDGLCIRDPRSTALCPELGRHVAETDTPAYCCDSGCRVYGDGVEGGEVDYEAAVLAAEGEGGIAVAAAAHGDFGMSLVGVVDRGLDLVKLICSHIMEDTHRRTCAIVSGTAITSGL